ncbi:MAG: knotted carbamoyltransferase YgeW [Kiritimatiellia bacterium]
MSKKIKSLIDQMSKLKTGLYENDFLLTWEQSDADLRAVLLAAEIFEELFREGIQTPAFKNGLAVSIFRDQSTRTRFSFASAASLLGLTLMDMDEKKSQVAHGETVRETANMISFLTEVIGIRDDMYIGEGHEYMKEVSNAVKEGLRDGVLPQKPAILNLQCDRDHPTQSMADLMHLQKTFGSLENLRGKKIAMTWAYSPSYGKPLSVPQGIIGLMSRFGMNVSLAYPKGYDLMPDIVKKAGEFAKASGGKFEVVNSMEDAFADADIVYPKSWAPFSIMEQRTKMLRGGEAAKLGDLEKQCLANNLKFKDWECTEELMKKTKDGKALYMHCLPADITGVSCKQGEVAATVFDRYRTRTYMEAEHKPYVMAAMVLNNRFKDPSGLLKKFLDDAIPRRGGK